ncbi:hypothetical protein H0H93_011785 [Arthromyces matolae]|nr:hypothetical protein H0H93_011785 [Arthromyces matolae]
MFLLCWRRRARRQRAKRTAMFATAKQLDHKLTWRNRLVRIGERLFGHSPTRRPVLPTHSEEMKLRKSKVSEDGRDSLDIDQFINAYDYPKEESHYSKASSQSGLDEHQLPFKMRRQPHRSLSSRLSAHSIYSEVTGHPRNAPEPRQPIRNDFMTSRRQSSSTLSSSYTARPRELERGPGVRPTEAEAYASSVRTVLVASPPIQPGAYSNGVKPTHTGTSSNNPFRHLV